MTTNGSRANILHLAFLVAAMACGGGGGSGSGNGPDMKPGENCLSCHTFTLAGTVFAAGTLQGAPGVDVKVTDKAAVVRHYTSNTVGNFYTYDPIQFPVDVAVSRGAGTSTMLSASSGACNGCHTSARPMTVP